jgi:beta-glucosidase
MFVPLPQAARRRARTGAAALGVGVLLATLVSWLPAETAFGSTGLPVVENFEGSLPITTASPGIFPFGSDAASTPTLTQVAVADRPGGASDDHGLDVTYHVGSYGGFSDNLSTAQNWSGYGGFSFWVKETATGQRIEFEIKDGGPDGEHAEL